MKGNTLWVLVSGLAVGLLVGREWGRHSVDGTAGEDKPSSAAAPSADKQVAGTIPPDWIKEDGLGADKFAGLSAAQIYTVLKVMNEKPCDCGCPHGSFAKCKKEDPGCPRAPVAMQQAIDLAKAGKGPEEIKSAITKPSAPAQAQQAPQGPAKIELAAWTPIKGPKHAKVTIVEFSDFQ
jgi:hypothetical protein